MYFYLFFLFICKCIYVYPSLCPRLQAWPVLQKPLYILSYFISLANSGLRPALGPLLPAWPWPLPLELTTPGQVDGNSQKLAGQFQSRALLVIADGAA